MLTDERIDALGLSWATYFDNSLYTFDKIGLRGLACAILAAPEGCDRNALWSYVAQHAVIVDASVEGVVSITIARDAGSGACAEAVEKAVRALRQPEGL